MRRPAPLVAVAILLATHEARAQAQHAEEPTSPLANLPQAAAPGRTEVDGVPIVGGDSDIGWGGGVVGAITHYSLEGPSQWDWRLVGSAFLTFRVSPSFGVPYQDHWLQLIMPGLLDGKLRFETRIAYTKENNVKFFGLGNAAPTPPDSSSPFFVYERTHPMLEAYARVALAPRLYAIAGSTLTLNLLDVPANTLLAQQMQFGSPEVRSLLGNANNHGVVILQESIGYDSRDDEIVPRRGTWDQIDLRVSPSLGSWVPYSFGEIIGTARFYEPIGSRVVVAARALVDLLFGTPPFYQLTEYDDTYAIGGTAGIRGVPAQRYYGKIKLIGNLEARVDAAHFHFAGKPWQVAVVGFFDAGRLWADWTSQPQLDGTGLGIKWGTGVGVRVQQGQAFVVRGDIAWSPDAQPLAGYFAVGETF